MNIETYEDFEVGQKFTYPVNALSKDEIIAFARHWDMQPFHVDEAAAEKSIYGGLIASGFQTMLTCFKPFAENVLSKARCQGAPGLDYLKWLRPWRPNTPLQSQIEIVAKRTSKSDPRLGIVTFVTSAYELGENRKEKMFEMKNSFFVYRASNAADSGAQSQV